MDGFDRLRAGIACVRVAHHLRGRIRLKLDGEPEGLPLPSAEQVRHFHTLLQDIEGVHSVRVNLLARSCTVEYDPAVIPMDAWSDFLAGARSAAAATLEDILRAKYREVVNA